MKNLVSKKGSFQESLNCKKNEKVKKTGENKNTLKPIIEDSYKDQFFITKRPSHHT